MVRDRRRRGVILENMPRARAHEPSQLTSVFSGERSDQIMQAMDRLSDNHRHILMARYYRDLSYAELAETLDIKLGTVMSRLSRAKAALVDVLGTGPAVGA